MSFVITIPKILRDKLSEEGAQALVETLNKLEESHKSNVLEVVEGRFERRLTEVKQELLVEMANNKAELIKFMFLFWIGQSATTVGILFVFFK